MSASISTHVLDTARGRPAAGIAVTLSRDGTVVARGVTDADGRIRELARDLAPGTYRLAFDVGTAFFQAVSFDVVVGDGPHHVPLLLSPFGVASYRGS